MLQKFKELRNRLDSIDSVLNEEEMNRCNDRDKFSGFCPSKEYAPKDFKEFKGMKH